MGPEHDLPSSWRLSRRDFLRLTAAAGLVLAGCERLRARLRIGLALGGGGAKGLAHIPMLEVLDELGIRPRRIAGTSIGAIAGALYAAGLSAAQIRSLVEQFLVTKESSAKALIPLPRSLRWLDFLDPSLSAGGLLDSADFIAFLGEALPVRRFRDLAIPLQVVAADLWTGQQVVLESGEILPALQASMAVPGVFPPVDLAGRQLVDGGIVNPLPYDLLLDDCDLVIAIDVSGSYDHKDDDKLSFIGVLFHSFNLMTQNLIAERLKHSQPQIYIKPDITDVRVLEFYKAEQVFEQAQPAKRRLHKALKRFADV